MTKSGGCRFACPGLRRSLGFQPAWVGGAIRFHLLFSPLGLSGTRRVPHALDMRKICGNPRDLWATTKRTMAKEQAGCIYSPTDLSDKHRCHADYLSITQIAPSARQIDTDFSHAESNMYGSMPHDGACLIRGKSV